MSISTLSIQGVRNLLRTDLTLSPHINVFYDDNGAGKTSVLEAIHFLSMARSFKPARTKTLISHEETEAFVNAQSNHAGLLSVRRTVKGQVQVKRNNQALTALADLVHLMPLQSIDSSSFLLLEGTPSDRRQFLDWGVFHQFESFHKEWQIVQKSVKNRNSLLRSGRIDRSEMKVWEQQFIASSNRIDELRQQYLVGFVPCFHSVLSKLIELPGLKVHYFRGWDKSKELVDLLDQQRERDTALGYTQSGPQRADMRIKVDKINAADVLSRGQQKLVVCALKLAQSLYLQKELKQPTTFLLDDLPAELDQHHIEKLGELMEQMEGQVFMTCVDPRPLTKFWTKPSQVKMFHVEHGNVAESTECGE